MKQLDYRLVLTLFFILMFSTLNAQIDQDRLKQLKDFPRQNQELLKNLQNLNSEQLRELKKVESMRLYTNPADEIPEESGVNKVPRDTLVKFFICNYQNNNPVLLGKYMKQQYNESEVTIIRDDSTKEIIDVVVNDCEKDRRLESWWIDAPELKDMLIPDSGLDASGIRLFPAVNLDTIQVKLNTGIIEDFSYYYHTLVIRPTIYNPLTDSHDNHQRAWEYVDPCPNVCKGADGEYRLKNCKKCK